MENKLLLICNKIDSTDIKLISDKLIKEGYLTTIIYFDDKEEIDEASNAIKVLGGKIEEIINFNLPDDQGERNIVVIKKIKPSLTKYPRIFKTIKDKPL